MLRDVEDGASGPEAFTLLLRRLMTHFDRVDTGEGCTRLHNFGVCTGTPFCDFSRERANSAVPLSRGINSATGGRVSNATRQPWQGSLRFGRRSPQPRVARH